MYISVNDVISSTVVVEIQPNIVLFFVLVSDLFVCVYITVEQ